MSKKAKDTLSIDDKLDRIMEAIVFSQQLHITTLKALDIILGKKEEENTSSSSKIIKPIAL